jgi:signal transduction histidine kinase
MAASDALRGNRHMLVSHRHRMRSGAYLWCDTAGYTDGRYFYLVCRDVRNRKAVEAALRAFTLSTSHDLREPCNAILVCVAMLERRACVAADNDAAFLTGAVRASCGLLLGIVANVLTAREVEANELQLDTRIFCPEAVLSDVLTACRMACAAGGETTLVWDRTPGDLLPPLLEGDPSRIGAVLQNLLINACKFSAGGTVTLRACLEAPDAHGTPVPSGASASASLAASPSAAAAAPRPWLTVRVSDTGCGMTDEEARACFTAYHHSAASAGGGHGLGLYVSKAFAQLMGGTLSVVTAPGRGAAFTLSVPVRVPCEAEASAHADAAAEAAAQPPPPPSPSPPPSPASTPTQTSAAPPPAEAPATPRLGDAAAEQSSSSSGGSGDAASRATSFFRSAGPPQRSGSGSSTRSPRYSALVADDHSLNLRLGALPCDACEVVLAPDIVQSLAQPSVTRLMELHGFDVKGVVDGGAALSALKRSYDEDASPFDVCILDMQVRRAQATRSASCPNIE